MVSCGRFLLSSPDQDTRWHPLLFPFVLLEIYLDFGSSSSNDLVARLPTTEGGMRSPMTGRWHHRRDEKRSASDGQQFSIIIPNPAQSGWIPTKGPTKNSVHSLRSSNSKRLRHVYILSTYPTYYSFAMTYDVLVRKCLFDSWFQRISHRDSDLSTGQIRKVIGRLNILWK